MARKRNLEGNSHTSLMFSDLSNANIQSLSADMGVVVDHISFGTFDILRDMEIAMNKLHAKTHETPNTLQIEELDDEGDVKERLIEWLQDDLSETESEILALSKKKGKLSKRKLKISPKNNKSNQGQEAPGLKNGNCAGKNGLQSPKQRVRKR
jgi:predicted metal-dependent TIM-barrel fold hydrolase